jgi:hypothetical protein
MGSQVSNTEGSFRPLICLAVALPLVFAFTVARSILIPVLGAQSPYMLYVAAVLIAGFARGGFCGFLVMLGSGLTGFMLFAGWDRSLATLGGPLASLLCFWVVAALALMMANELRRHANVTFSRLRRQVDAASARSGEGSVTQRVA